MKMIMSVLCALVACGGSNKGTATGSAANSGVGQPCTQELVIKCPTGQIDACVKALAADEKKSTDGDESGGSGTAMALDEGRMSKLETAGTHRCVAK